MRPLAVRLGKDPADQCRRGVFDWHCERHQPASGGRFQGAQRAQARLLRLGSRRIYRALSAQYVLGRAVREDRCPGWRLAQ